MKKKQLTDFTDTEILAQAERIQQSQARRFLDILDKEGVIEIPVTLTIDDDTFKVLLHVGVSGLWWVKDMPETEAGT